MEKTDYMHADTNSEKLKVGSMIFWVCQVKNCRGLLVHEVPKYALSKE